DGRPLRRADGRAGRSPQPRRGRGCVMLCAKPQPGANIVFRGARVIDPVEGIDASLDVRIDDGVIAALGERLDPNEHRVVAAITRAQHAEELTEMGALADAGAVAFTDDGVPVSSAGLLRRALQYASTTGRLLAVHCEEPSLSCDGHVHAGAVAAELGFTAYPSVAESVMVER